MRSFLKDTICRLLLILLTVINICVFPLYTYAQSVTDLENQLEQKNNQVKAQESLLDKIKKEIDSINKSSLSIDEKITLMNNEIKKIDKYIDEYEILIGDKEKKIAAKQAEVDSKVGDLSSSASLLYKKTRNTFLDQLILSLFDEGGIRQVLFNQIFMSRLSKQAKLLSQDFAEIKSAKIQLEQDKTELESQKKELLKSKSDLISQKNVLSSQVAYRNATTQNIKKQITLLKNDISDLQAAILAAKSGSSYVNAADVPSGGSGSLSVFRSSPSSGGANPGEFGVFAFGAYTHRNGMSQWGAKARSDAGQSYQTILSAYYPGKVIRTGTVVIGGTSQNIMTNIKTTTNGTLNFEDDYLMRLGEMPESWSLEALKAQAIAARTYAVNYTSNGSKTICTTQSCQVIANKKTGKWKTAVEQTRGMILTNSNGTAFSAQYAAVHGGWENGVGWDTTDKKGLYSGWTKNAWDSISGVSWFYKAWSTLSANSSTCSVHSKAWLTPAEMVDLLNTYLVIKEGKGNPARILPETIGSCPISGLSGNPYSKSEISALLSSPVTSITSALASQSNGSTTSISFVTNKGVINISGADFKQVFNMRAPGYLTIPQNAFVFINIERK